MTTTRNEQVAVETPLPKEWSCADHTEFLVEQQDDATT
jgi:hypothetical protein